MKGEREAGGVPEAGRRGGGKRKFKPPSLPPPPARPSTVRSVDRASLNSSNRRILPSRGTSEVGLQLIKIKTEVSSLRIDIDRLLMAQK